MHRKLLEVLGCPGCHGSLRAPEGETIETGELHCDACARTFPIVHGIPRFVASDNYASSFGLQWNAFRAEQLDCLNGTGISRRRLRTETGWDPAWMRGKWILDAGCGSGRFLDVASADGANVVGLDLSNAVDASAESLRGRDNVHLVQASIYELPFRRDVFDAIYCIGVIQHTPDPARALRTLPSVLRPCGRLAVTIYERRRFTKLHAKYWARKLTTRMNERTLLHAVQWTMPIAFPFTEVLFRLPLLGRFFRFALPVANYPEIHELTLRQRYRWAVLDTYDMLAPAYDQPQTFDEARAALEVAGMKDVRRLNPRGLNLVGERAA